MCTKLGLFFGGLIFGVVAVLQLLRFILGVSVVIGGVDIPHWYSLILAVILFGMSYWLLACSFCKTSK